MTTLLPVAARLAPHLATAGLHALRLVPVALLCPFLGGPLVPGFVRLAIAAGFGAVAYAVAGSIPMGLSPAAFAAGAAREIAIGCALGLLASLPLEAARAGGRLVDTLRGATLSELHVPLVRQRETAVGDFLVQWAVVLAVANGGDRLVLRAVLSSFQALPVGAPVPPAALLEIALRGASALVACAFSVSAPAAAGILAVDLALAVSSRAAPNLGLPGAAQPARAALGLFAIAAAGSVIAGKLLGLVALSAALTRSVGTGGLAR